MAPKIAFMGHDSLTQLRALQMGQNLNATPLFFKNEEAIIEAPQMIESSTMVFLPVLDLSNEAQMSARVQTVKYAAPEAWIIIIGDKKISPEGAQFLKKSGAQVVISEDRFFHTIEPEFISSIKIHGQWLPIKGSELVIGKKIPFSLYHFMPLNKKFVLFAHADAEVDNRKIEKAKKVGEVYFHREDFDLFQKYIADNEDKTAAGLVARCRHQYMSAAVLFKEFGLHLTDVSEQSSFQKGKELLERCYSIADDFVMTLGTVGDSWSIVNHAGFDDLTPIDRAPAIGATASLLSLLSGTGNPTQVFLCTLLADLGLLELPPIALKAVQLGQFHELSGESLDLYRYHPSNSVNRVLNRKLPLDERTKSIILATHEKVNGKGFPNGLDKEKVPPESQLIHLAELMDVALKLQEGKERVDHGIARRTALENLSQQGVASLDLVLKILNSLDLPI